MMSTYLDAHGAPHPDRREHSHLRGIFEEFRATVEPFLSRQSSWGGANLSYLAHREIQERYPQMDAHEINILIQAVVRVVREAENAA